VWAIVRLAWNEGLHLLVEDDGPGVEVEAAETLSARGSRLDETTPGHGLGLSIVRDIVLLQGGKARFGRSRDLGGFVSDITIPAPQGPQTIHETAHFEIPAPSHPPSDREPGVGL
jgi:signal transduction histidine kinase